MVSSYSLQGSPQTVIPLYFDVLLYFLTTLLALKTTVRKQEQTPGNYTIMMIYLLPVCSNKYLIYTLYVCVQ